MLSNQNVSTYLLTPRTGKGGGLSTVLTFITKHHSRARRIVMNLAGLARNYDFKIMNLYFFLQSFAIRN